MEAPPWMFILSLLMSISLGRFFSEFMLMLSALVNWLIVFIITGYQTVNLILQGDKQFVFYRMPCSTIARTITRVNKG